MQEWTDGNHGATEMLKPVHAARGETQQPSSPGDEKHMRSSWKSLPASGRCLTPAALGTSMDQGPSGIAFNGSKNENEFDDGQPCLDDAEEGLAMCHLKNNFCCEILRTGRTSNKHVTTAWTLVTGRSGTLRAGLQGSGAEGKQESERQLHPPSSAHP